MERLEQCWSNELDWELFPRSLNQVNSEQPHPQPCHHLCMLIACLGVPSSWKGSQYACSSSASWPFDSCLVLHVPLCCGSGRNQLVWACPHLDINLHAYWEWKVFSLQVLKEPCARCSYSLWPDPSWFLDDQIMYSITVLQYVYHSPKMKMKAPLLERKGRQQETSTIRLPERKQKNPVG